MTNFTKEKIAFAVALLAVLFTISPLIVEWGSVGYELFGLFLTVRLLYYVLAISLALSVYFYSFQFLVERYSYLNFTEAFGNAFYAIVVIAPPLYLMLFLIVELAKLVGYLFMSIPIQHFLEVVLSVAIGVISTLAVKRLQTSLVRKEKQSTVERLENKELDSFRKAEQLLQAGHFDLSVVEAFKAIEIATRKIMARGLAKEQDKAQNWINTIENSEVLPNELIPLFHNVQQLRNNAVHTLEPISSEEATKALLMTSRILAAMTTSRSSKNPSLYSTYEVGEGEVRLTVKIGDAQIGSCYVSLDGTKIAVGQVDNLMIGKGFDLHGKQLLVKSIVSVTNPNTNHTSIRYILHGGKIDKDFFQEFIVVQYGDSINYEAVFKLTP